MHVDLIDLRLFVAIAEARGDFLHPRVVLV